MIKKLLTYEMDCSVGLTMRSVLQQQFTKMSRSIVSMLVAVGIATVLSACAPQQKTVPTLTKMQKRHLAFSLMEQQGVKVVHRGNQVDVLIPTQLLFQPQSTNVIEQAAYVLSPLYHAIKTYDVESVRIAGLTATHPTADEKLLTRARAGIAGQHIWQDGLNKQVPLVAGGLRFRSTQVGSLMHGFSAPVIWVHWRYYTTPRMYD